VPPSPALRGRGAPPPPCLDAQERRVGSPRAPRVPLSHLARCAQVRKAIAGHTAERRLQEAEADAARRLEEEEFNAIKARFGLDSRGVLDILELWNEVCAPGTLPVAGRPRGRAFLSAATLPPAAISQRPTACIRHGSQLAGLQVTGAGLRA
jgi:hypothetical protein